MDDLPIYPTPQQALYVVDSPHTSRKLLAANQPQGSYRSNYLAPPATAAPQSYSSSQPYSSSQAYSQPLKASSPPVQARPLNYHYHQSQPQTYAAPQHYSQPQPLHPHLSSQPLMHYQTPQAPGPPPQAVAHLQPQQYNSLPSSYDYSKDPYYMQQQPPPPRHPSGQLYSLRLEAHDAPSGSLRSRPPPPPVAINAQSSQGRRVSGHLAHDLPLASKHSDYAPPSTSPKIKLEQELRAVFTKVDQNRSGTISARELGQALTNFDNTKFHESTIDLMIKLFGTPGDVASGPHKTLKFDQFVALWKYLSAYKKLFVQADSDRLGDITFGEFQNILEQIGYKLNVDLVLNIFQKFSLKHSNGTVAVGKLKFDSFIELLVYMRKLTDVFKKYDTDLKGVATINFSDFLFELNHLI